MAKRLLKVKAGGKVWFVDFKLDEARNVRDVHERMSLMEFDEKFGYCFKERELV